MTTTDREQKRQRFAHAFPHSGRIERALAVEGNRAPFCFIHESRDPDLTECTLVVARLGREIEDQFGIDSEVIFLFSPYQHLQHRLLDALITRGPAEIIEGQVEALKGVRYTPDWFLTFIVCPDEEASEKIREWNESGKTSLAIPVAATSGAGGEIRQGLVREIANVLEERDLYNLYRGRNPVTGSAFFGRTDLLRRISGSIRDGRSLGLFGLRRSGKTSVIREYQRRRREGSEIVVLSDLEAMQELHEFPHHIGEDLNEALREQRVLGKPAYVGSESTQYVETSADLSRRIKQLAKRNPDLRFVIAVDEIESLTSYTDSDPKETRSFLGSLRTAAQATGNVSLLFTGITTRFFSQSELARGVDNPLFGFVDPIYLRPFQREDSTHLIKSLGRKMLLRWDDAAAEAVHTEAGGFPFLVRDLASHVRSSVVGRRTDPLEWIEVSKADVDSARVLWAEESAALWSEIVRSLELHHPIMGALLAASESDIREWLDAGAEADSEARALEELGLFVRNEGGFVPTPALKALQGLGRQQTRSTERVRERIETGDELSALIRSGESVTLEFKETSRVNVRTRARDKTIEAAVVKTVAGFMNAEGGVLLIGVSDGGSVVGLKVDLGLHHRSIDSFENWLQGSLLVRACGTDSVAEHVAVDFPSIAGTVVCRICVSASPDPVWVEHPVRGAFLVRVGNATRQLHGREQHDYIRRHWPNR